MLRKDTWSVTLPSTALQLDMMKYTACVPILGPCGFGCSVEKEMLGGAIRLRHTGWRGCVTEAVIELPDDVGSECSVLHTANILSVEVLHHLHSRWWDAVVALCIAADDGDAATWDAAWAALERVALEKESKSVRERAKALMDTTPLPADVATAITERACLKDDEWMLGGAMYVLHFAHAAMDRDQPAPGALGRLEQVLMSGGLTRGEVVAACKCGIACPYRGSGWVEVDGVSVHEVVLRCTGMAATELLSGSIIPVCGPLRFFRKSAQKRMPTSTEERAAIKARALQV